MGELERMLNLILTKFPDVLFMSTLEMADGIRQRDPELIELRHGPPPPCMACCASGRFHDSANWRG